MVSSREMPRLLRPTWMEVDLDALAHNVREVKRSIGPERRLIAVAKGNARGLGVAEVVPAMVEAGAEVVAVGNLHEAISIREAGCRAPLLLFGSNLPEEAAQAVVEHRIIPTLWDLESARLYSRAARGPLEVYLKVDTGFRRIGVLPEQAAEVARGIESLPNLRIGCIYTHFADPVQGEEFTREQYRQFVEAVEAIRAAGVAAPYVCAASSAVVSLHPDMRLNAVDPGRLLFGIDYGLRGSPSPEPRVPIDVRLVARSVKSRIIQLKPVRVGESVGYGRHFRARRPTLVAVLPMGWGDGLLRGVAGGASVLVGGRRCPIIAALSLEHSMVDVTDVEGVRVGDEAVLWGEQGDEAITLGEQAAWAGASETEVQIRLGQAISRVYFRGGRVVRVCRR